MVQNVDYYKYQREKEEMEINSFDISDYYFKFCSLQIYDSSGFVDEIDTNCTIINVFKSIEIDRYYWIDLTEISIILYISYYKVMKSWW